MKCHIMQQFIYGSVLFVKVSVSVAQLVEHKTRDWRVATSRLIRVESLCCVLQQDTLSAA